MLINQESLAFKQIDVVTRLLEQLSELYSYVRGLSYLLCARILFNDHFSSGQDAARRPRSPGKPANSKSTVKEISNKIEKLYSTNFRRILKNLDSLTLVTFEAEIDHVRVKCLQLIKLEFLFNN